MESLFIPVILGTGRKDRQTEKAANFVLGKAQEYGFNTEFVDVRDHLWGETIPAWIEDERTAGWKDIAARADGFIFVFPEYNNGYPGELKILLDGAYKEYAKKPAGLCGVSSGIMGGARAVENIKSTLSKLSLAPTFNTLYFSTVEEFSPESPDEMLLKRVGEMFGELAWYANALKNAKGN